MVDPDPLLRYDGPDARRVIEEVVRSVVPDAVASLGAPQAREPIRGGFERRELLREREPQLRPAELRTREERRARHRRDARVADESVGEGHVILVGEVADVGHDVVRAGRPVDAEPRRLERRDEDVAPFAVPRQQIRVVGGREAQRRHRRCLERRRGADGQEVVDAPDATDRSAGAIVQPIRQPVTEYVFDIEWIDTVRSAIPGSVARGMCSPSNTRCS